MEKSDLSHHILSRYNDDLERVRTNVLQMGGFVEEQLKQAVEALVQGDSRLGEQVARGDQKVNAMEVAIDDDCSRILATRSPAAGDLRLIVAVIKTITDLERIGDEAEKIGYIGSRLAAVERPADRYREIKHLGRIVADMVHEALDAFARMDAQAAVAVAKKDRLVDEEYEAIQRQVHYVHDGRSAHDSPRAGRALGGSRPRAHRRSRKERLRVRRVHGVRQRHSSPCDRGRRAAAAGPSAATAERLQQLNSLGSLLPRRMPGMSALLPNRRLANGLWLPRVCRPHGLRALSRSTCSGLPPCPLCIFQRVAVISVGVIFLIAALHNPRIGWRSRVRRADPCCRGMRHRHRGTSYLDSSPAAGDRACLRGRFEFPHGHHADHGGDHKGAYGVWRVRQRSIGAFLGCRCRGGC